MLNLNNKTKNITLSSLVTTLLLITSKFFFIAQVNADEINSESLLLHSVSYGSFKNQLNDEKRTQIIQANKLIEISKPPNNKANFKTRNEILNNHSALLNKSSKQETIQKSSRDYYADFSIYGATSFLIDDFDDDGFYQTFSIVFDADMYSYAQNPLSEVYAVLYISKNGKPWEHYFTTDSFLIEGESDLDEYEVITTFMSGYSTDYYDVLIDLHQVGYSDIVASYSSDDSNALYALPIESENYDQSYIEVVEVYGGGSFSFIALFITLIFSVLRFRAKQSSK
jgi:hypothetical protein